MKKHLAALALLLGGLVPAAHAIDTFNADNNVLTLDSVVVNGTQFNNVSVFLGNYYVLGIGSSQPWIPDTCGNDNITSPRYNAIGLGMNITQVIQILGCKYDPALTYRNSQAIVYTWHAGTATINVFFETSGYTTKDIGGGVFKQAQGF